MIVDRHPRSAGGVQDTSVEARRPRLLFVTGHSPCPPTSGGRRREFELLRRVSPIMDVEICVVSKTFEEDERHIDDLRSLGATVWLHRAEPIRDDDLTLLERRQASDAATARVRDAVRRRDPPDLIHVEGFHLRQHLAATVPVPVVLGTQNVEHLLESQRLAVGYDGATRSGLVTLRRREIAAWRASRLVLAVTDDDAQVIARERCSAAVRVVPDGYDHSSALGSVLAVEPVRLRRPSAVFVGNFGYSPNVDAVIEFHRTVLPRILRSHPDLHFYVVGNAPPPHVRKLAGDHVTVTGRVPQVEPYLQAADVFVCPLRIGGGVKVKVLEALREGCAVVTTEIGIQGLGAVRTLTSVADDAASFAAAVVRAVEDARRMPRFRPRSLPGMPTWDDAAAALLEAYAVVIPGLRSRLRAPALARPSAAVTTACEQHGVLRADSQPAGGDALEEL